MSNVRIYLQTFITLASSALGFVAALAWNEAIKSTIDTLLGGQAGLTGLYIYAILATVLAIVVLSILARLASRVGGEAVITREVD